MNDDDEYKKHDYATWLRVVVTSGILAFATVFIQTILTTFFDIDYNKYVSSVVLIVAVFVLPFIYAKKEKGKLPIIIWLEALALIFNISIIIPRGAWLRFAVQAIIAIILFITYRKYRNKLF